LLEGLLEDAVGEVYQKFRWQQFFKNMISGGL
jgi:hypothetical protein